jgi:hypothetical protein
MLQTIAVIHGMNDYPYDPEDDDYEPDHEEWVPLGYGRWLILHTFPDGGAEVLEAEQQPGGGFRIYL